MAARGPALQGPDPHEIPQHRVPRPRGLRGAVGGPDVLLDRCEAPHPRAVGSAGRADLGPQPFRSVRAPGERVRPAQRRAPVHARGVDDRAPGLPCRHPRAHRAGTGRGDRPVPVPLLRRLLQAVVPREPGVRRQPAGAVQAPVHRGPSHHDHRRPPAAGAGGVRDAIRARLPRRPRRRDDRHRPAHRVRARDGRRQEPRLLARHRRRAREPRYGQGRPRTPDRLRLQALCPRGSPRERLVALDGVRGSRLDRHPDRGWPHLACHERRGKRVRHDDPAERHGELREHRLRSADRSARCREGRGDGGTDGHAVLPPGQRAPHPAPALPLRGARHERVRTPWRWRAPTAPSPPAAGT